MATLTQAAAVTKKFLLIAIIVIVAGIGTKIGYDIASGLIKKVNPPAPPPPTVSFGKLPSLDFKAVETITLSEGLNFKIDTVEGGVPNFPDRATVFPINKGTVSFLSLDNATIKVKRINFQSPPEALSEVVYKWTDSSLPSRQIVVNIVNKQFNLSYDFFSDSEILQRQTQVDPKESVKAASKFFSTMETRTDDFVNEKTATLLLNISGGRLAIAKSLQEADVVRVNFVRKDLDKLPFISPFPDKSTISALVTTLGKFGDNRKQIAEANYLYWQPEIDKSATYPIKTGAEAFNELKNGKGYVVAKFVDEPVITIKKIFLAYLELPVDYQAYLLPVFAFEGDNGFRAVVPAVKNEYLETKFQKP